MARDLINRRINEILSGRDCAYWLEQLESQRIPCSPVNSFSQALGDPQGLHRNMVVELFHPDGASTRGPGNPIKLSRTGEESFTPAPALGAQTDAIMSGLLGLDDQEIRRLREEGIIG